MESIKANEINEIIRAQIENFDASMTVAEVGTVVKVGDGIAEVYGLEKVMAGELLEFGGGAFGLALNLEEDQVRVGDAMIGRVVNALGQPVDDKGPVFCEHANPLERIAPGIVDRQPVKEP